MAKIDLEIHTTYKDIKDIPTNKELMEALRSVVEIPDNVKLLTLLIQEDKPAMMTFIKAK